MASTRPPQHSKRRTTRRRCGSAVSSNGVSAGLTFGVGPQTKTRTSVHLSPRRASQNGHSPLATTNWTIDRLYCRLPSSHDNRRWVWGTILELRSWTDRFEDDGGRADNEERRAEAGAARRRRQRPAVEVVAGAHHLGPRCHTCRNARTAVLPSSVRWHL